MLSARYLACFLLLGMPALGQVGAAAVDTVGYARGSFGPQADTFYLGKFTTMDSTTVQAYLPAARMGYEAILNYFETPPGRKPHPKRYTLNIIQVHTMRVHGRYYENLVVDDESIDVLSLRVLNGPVEVFTYAEPRSIPVPIPLPGAHILFAGVAYTNNHWYLRRRGQVITVNRGKFAQQLSAFLADCPALAQPVARGEAHYRYQDTPAIIDEYNRYLATKGK